MDFNRLPEEILEKILLMCPDEEIPELTLVSKRFNQVIGNSSRLMRNFEVQWEPRSGENKFPLMISNRKYRKISVTSDNARFSLQIFLKNNARSLSWINLCDCSVTSTELKDLLNLVASNLEELTFCGVSIKVDCPIQPIELPKLCDMEVMYGEGDGYTSVIPMFKGAKLERLSYEDEEVLSPQKVNGFADFLSSQKNLSELSLSDNVACKLFEREQHDDWYQDMKLIKVYLILKNLAPIGKQNFGKFLSHQKDSIKILTLFRVVLSEDLLNTVLQSNLEELRLVCSTFESEHIINVVNTSIRVLFLSSFDDDDDFADAMHRNLMRACSAMKKVCIRNATITFDTSIIMARYVDIQTLDLWKCKVMPITYPRLRNLKFSKCDISAIVRLIRCNWNLDEITAPRVYRRNQMFLNAVQETMAKSVVYL